MVCTIFVELFLFSAFSFVSFVFFLLVSILFAANNYNIWIKLDLKKIDFDKNETNKNNNITYNSYILCLYIISTLNVPVSDDETLNVYRLVGLFECFWAADVNSIDGCMMCVRDADIIDLFLLLALQHISLHLSLQFFTAIVALAKRPRPDPDSKTI